MTRDPPPVRLRRRGLVAVGAGAAVALVAGLVAVWPFGARHDRPPPVRSRTPMPLVNRATDPCTLADPAALTRFGKTRLATDYGNFNRCDVIVRSGRNEVDVKFQLESATEGADQPPAAKVGGFPVARERDSDGECDRDVILPGGSLVNIAAQQDDGSSDRCAIADAATARTVAVLSRGSLPQRTGRPNPASLFNVDACGLLDADALARFPGVDALHPESGFGGWMCTWNSTTSPSRLRLIFDRNGPPDASDGRPVRVGGHQAFIDPSGYAPKTCEVMVVNRQYVDTAGEDTAELVLVLVDGPQPSRRRCALATTLAGAVAARLPRT